MIITKQDKKLYVQELPSKWRISTKIGNMPVDYEVSKKDCPTIADVEVYVLNNKIF